MTVTISGTSGITSPGGDTNVSLTSTGNDTAAAFIPSGSTAPTNGVFLPASNVVGFSTNSTERMRIDSSGNLLVGLTSAPANTASSGAYFSYPIAATGYSSRAGVTGAYSNNRFNLSWTTGTQLWIDTTNTGTITVTSDYRIKKGIQTQTVPALDRIAKIRSVTYTYSDNENFSWKSDGVEREGFIAHELQEIIPSAVEGEKDAEHQIQSLRLDALCSVMVKAIQELSAQNKELEARLAILEAK